jgi:hypothetical protein
MNPLHSRVGESAELFRVERPLMARFPFRIFSLQNAPGFSAFA